MRRRLQCDGGPTHSRGATHPSHFCGDAARWDRAVCSLFLAVEHAHCERAAHLGPFLLSLRNTDRRHCRRHVDHCLFELKFERLLLFKRRIRVDVLELHKLAELTSGIGDEEDVEEGHEHDDNAATEEQVRIPRGVGDAEQLIPTVRESKHTRIDHHDEGEGDSHLHSQEAGGSLGVQGVSIVLGHQCECSSKLQKEHHLVVVGLAGEREVHRDSHAKAHAVVDCQDDEERSRVLGFAA
mmetsp:Transcript_31050/g.70145  ORF Transcript_31050/g.70145 Transcript_31050/m.70145 type:complete len:239 (+) Transcript_31050:254-970(+)